VDKQGLQILRERAPSPSQCHGRWLAETSLENFVLIYDYRVRGQRKRRRGLRPRDRESPISRTTSQQWSLHPLVTVHIELADL